MATEELLFPSAKIIRQSVFFVLKDWMISVIFDFFLPVSVFLHRLDNNGVQTQKEKRKK